MPHYQGVRPELPRTMSMKVQYLSPSLLDQLTHINMTPLIIRVRKSIVC
jgi:hypothetical protein